jgi:hypothetical protein
MKVYTTGHQHLLPRVAAALGLPTHVNHGRVLVAARTKAHAYQLLADRHLEPASIRDDEFRQAMGDDVDELARVGLFDMPVVLATPMVGHGSAQRLVVRVEPDTTVTVGRLESRAGDRVAFVPTAAGVHGPVPAQPYIVSDLVEVVAVRYGVGQTVAQELLYDALRAADAAADAPLYDDQGWILPDVVPSLLHAVERELEQQDLRAARDEMASAEAVLAALAANRKRVREVNDEMEELRRERQELAHRARQLSVLPEAATTLGVTVGRVSQLGDEYLAAMAQRRPQARA